MKRSSSTKIMMWYDYSNTLLQLYDGVQILSSKSNL